MHAMIYPDNRGEFRFTIYASNGEPIAVSSEGYVRRADCEHALNLIRQFR